MTTTAQVKRPFRVQINTTDGWQFWGSYSTWVKAHDALCTSGSMSRQYRILNVDTGAFTRWGRRGDL